MKANLEIKQPSRILLAAGIAGLVSWPLVFIANFVMLNPLSVRGNAVETALNILGNETQFRTGVTLELFFCVAVIIYLVLLYKMLMPFNNIVSLLAAAFRFLYLLMWLRIALNQFELLQLLDEPEYFNVFTTLQTQALAKMVQNLGSDQYYVGLLFWSLASLFTTYLLMEAKYLSKPFTAIGIAFSTWCLICTVLHLTFPPFDSIVNIWLFDLPMTLFEIGLNILLIYKSKQKTIN